LYVLAGRPKKSTNMPFRPASWSAIKHTVAPLEAIELIMPETPFLSIIFWPARLRTSVEQSQQITHNLKVGVVAGNH